MSSDPIPGSPTTTRVTPRASVAQRKRDRHSAPGFGPRGKASNALVSPGTPSAEADLRHTRTSPDPPRTEAPASRTSMLLRSACAWAAIGRYPSGPLRSDIHTGTVLFGSDGLRSIASPSSARCTRSVRAREGRSNARRSLEIPASATAATRVRSDVGREPPVGARPADHVSH